MLLYAIFGVASLAGLKQGGALFQHDEDTIRRFLAHKLDAWTCEGMPFHLWLTSPACEVLDVTFAMSERRLVIEVAEPERVPQAEAFARIARVADGNLLKRDLDRFVMELERDRRCRHR